MRRILIGAASLALALTLGTSSASAQFFVGGGLTMPSSDFKDFVDEPGNGAKTGWMATAGFRLFGSEDGRFSVWGEGFYGSNTHEVDGEKTNIVMGGGSASYALTGSAGVAPYVIGGVGYLNHQFKPDGGNSESDWMFAWSAGGGLSFSQKFWLEGRYVNGSKDGDKTAYVMLMAGITL